MNHYKEDFDNLLQLTLAACQDWVSEQNGETYFIDPIDQKEITAHYGTTHAAASFIIVGQKRENKELLNIGLKLLKSILNRWEDACKLYAYHFDFNNFALCVVYDYLQHYPEIQEKIKTTICSTVDSNHFTINWLPMRWYVNQKRYEWTKDDQYLKTIATCKTTIASATNADGGIEDILPKGKSYNLQYNLATVAALQYLKHSGVEVHLTKEINFLLQNIAPNGDINYQGRGTNQIFAWGMWLYLLKSSGLEKDVDLAINFLKDKVPQMLENNNLMLNFWKGKEKHLWWDYHYSSVYTAHFLFWLVLTDELKKNNEVFEKKEHALSDTGVRIYKSKTTFVTTFNGRSKYLAEKGPLITLLFTEKHGTMFKGTFGPWQGMFGNEFTFGDVIFRNFFGLLKQKQNKDFSKNRIINKLFPNLTFENKISFSPLFVEVQVEEKKNALSIHFKNDKREEVLLNIPVLESSKTPILSLTVDNKEEELYQNIKIKNQYGWCKVYQSKVFTNQNFSLKIEL